jgi:hypothetical protein
MMFVLITCRLAELSRRLHRGKERGDLEIKDYVVLQKPQVHVDRLPPPRTLIFDFTMTHTRYDRSHLNFNGQLTT